MRYLKTQLIITKSKSTEKYIDAPKLDVPKYKIEDFILKDMIRKDSINIPEVSEPEVVRHFVNLSVKNHHIDKDFIFPTLKKEIEVVIHE